MTKIVMIMADFPWRHLQIIFMLFKNTFLGKLNLENCKVAMFYEQHLVGFLEFISLVRISTLSSSLTWECMPSGVGNHLRAMPWFQVFDKIRKDSELYNITISY